jgi:microcystin-dependent protein
MAQPYIGEIRMFAGNFAPAGWMFCEGQLLPISENDTLFIVFGTQFGGDGQSTFALPDLRGRVPIHKGSGITIAETGGSESVTLTVQQMPGHSHAMIGSATNGNSVNPNNALLANSTVVTPYASETPTVAMAGTSITAVGGSQPHTNFQPYLCLNFIVSLFGLFPSQT